MEYIARCAMHCPVQFISVCLVGFLCFWDALKYSRDVDGTPLALEHFDQVASKQTGDASSAGYGSQTDYSLQDQFNFLQKSNTK